MWVAPYQLVLLATPSKRDVCAWCPVTPSLLQNLHDLFLMMPILWQQELLAIPTPLEAGSSDPQNARKKLPTPGMNPWVFPLLLFEDHGFIPGVGGWTLFLDDGVHGDEAPSTTDVGIRGPARDGHRLHVRIA